MQVSRCAFVCALLSCAVAAGTAQEKKQLTFAVPAGATVSIANDYGSITVRAAPGNQVIVSATPHSSSVRIDAAQSGKRVDIRSVHSRSGGSDAVDYDVQAPPDASLLIRGISGPVQVQNLNGDIQIDSDMGAVSLQNAHSGLIRVQTIDGPITLADVSGGSIHLRSVTGAITLTNSAGRAVEAVSNSSAIRFTGRLQDSGECDLATHSGDIDVALPASASVDITASSVTGVAQDEFHLQADSTPGISRVAGKSFAGHAGSSGATMKLRTFSGKIIVHKQ